MRLVIDQAGTGHLNYADLALCPNCSFANAPRGTTAFVLTSVTNGVAAGHVTVTSDPKNGAIGAAVHARLTPGRPGQLLRVDVGGMTLLSFLQQHLRRSMWCLRGGPRPRGSSSLALAGAVWQPTWLSPICRHSPEAAGWPRLRRTDQAPVHDRHTS